MGQLKAVCKVHFTEGSVAYAIMGLRSGIVVVDEQIVTVVMSKV